MALTLGTRSTRRLSAQRHVRQGATLIELSAVLFVVTLLMALGIPAIVSTRESMRNLACQNNLRQIGGGLLDFHSAHQSFPAGRDAFSGRQHSWATRILPHIEQNSLFSQYRFNKPWNDSGPTSHNQQIAATHLSVYACPNSEHSAPGLSDYGGNYGSTLTGLPAGFATNQAWSAGVLVTVNIPGISQRPIRFADLVDGSSSTFLVMECASVAAGGAANWANGHHCIAHDHGPINSSRSLSIFSLHPGGANTAFCDGAVRFVSQQVEPKILGCLCNRSDRHSIDTSAYY